MMIWLRFGLSRLIHKTESGLEWIHEAITIFIGIFVAKVEKRTTPYTVFAFLMLLFGVGWFTQMMTHVSVWAWHEIIANTITNWTMIIFSLISIIGHKVSNKHVYKYASLGLCFICLIIGTYWLIIDALHFNGYSTVGVVLMGFVTNIIKVIGGGVLLLNYHKKDFE
ncbi:MULTISPECIES: hypothetical protein [Cysteiniphilum]|uniref:Uncharacterized protein n=1 Tax=Cysteiniphilum litorale TaxID=2056700 RepID=A0A8J2Z645_9GAMM|nr:MULTISPECIES: hypothetical protein [Cysteiniphilum]GGG03940.1 hypothetical protein GCM10010995_21760 [Cysteiniphilum litorale]